MENPNEIKRKQTQEEIYSQACEVLPGGVSRNTIFHQPWPHYVSSAEGCYITDIEGIRRIDFANNMASLIHGHAHPLIVHAAIEQIRKGTAFTMATETEVIFAQMLCDRAPGFEKIRFVNSGTEAVMATIKAARAFTGKPKIAKAEGAYHGTYDFAEISQTANPENWGSIDQPNSVPVVKGTPQGVLDDVVIYPFNDTQRTLAILDRYAGEIACVLVDPAPHRVGLIPAKTEFIEAIYAWTRKHNALLVFDEVVTFRVNFSGAQQNYSVKPDLTALGKMIGGGFPIGAFAGRSDIMSILDPREKNLPFPLSGTFSANPVSTNAGRKAMELFDEDAVKQLNQLTQKAREQINEVIKIADVPVSVTGTGSMFRIHLKAAEPASYREAYESKETLVLKKKMLDYLFYNKKILMTNTFSCFMSTVTGQREIDTLCDALSELFKYYKPQLDMLA